MLRVCVQSSEANAPVEVLALDFDVGHAIANLALTRLARSLLLAGTHSDSDDSRCTGRKYGREGARNNPRRDEAGARERRTFFMRGH